MITCNITFLQCEIMQKRILGVLLLTYFWLVPSVFGQVAAPLIIPGGSSVNPAVSFWKKSNTFSVVMGSYDLEVEAESQKINGNSKESSIQFAGKLSVIGLSLGVKNVQSDYDDYSVVTNFSNDSNLQFFNISSGIEFIAAGIGTSSEKSETKFDANSISSYTDTETSGSSLGVSLKSSEIYLGYYSGKDRSKRKQKAFFGERNFPVLETDSSGVGVGFLSEKSEMHTEVYFLKDFYASVEDNGSNYVNDEASTVGIVFEVVANPLSFGIIYQKESYIEEFSANLYEDYDADSIQAIIGFYILDNLNLTFTYTTYGYEQKYKNSGGVYNGLNYTYYNYGVHFIF